MWMDAHPGPPVARRLSRCRRVAIAIPARDEADLVAACLHAIDASAHDAMLDVPPTLLLLVNNSRDGTAALARQLGLSHVRLIVEEHVLAPGRANAGWARALAFRRALAHVPDAHVLMTTDADSRVARNWIAANLAEIDEGADAVAGIITFDADAPAWLATVRRARCLEGTLADRHAKLAHLIDPQAHNPWPNHIWAWGATLATTVAAYHRVGGVPTVALAEDRAFAEALERHDLKVRRSCLPLVHTSPRKTGRAPGGFADLLASYDLEPATWCDAALEPSRTLVHRLTLRRQLRDAFASGDARTPAARMAYAMARTGVSGFGMLWSDFERSQPSLARRRLHPAELSRELAYADLVIQTLEQSAARQSDIAACGTETA